MRQLRFIFLFTMVYFLSACASFSPEFEQPQVNITSFNLAPSSTASTPIFIIGLQVINPNRQALPLKGMSYSVEVDGYRILSGAEPDLPRVAAYGTEEFTIQAIPDLLGSAKLISQLMSHHQDAVKYRFKARLDIGSLFPFIDIEEAGELSLKRPSSSQ
ncbi:MAG: hypothetical protein CMH22_10880 [Methylophaga sp.]|uniref:LEA type 2 family protein n=1 Tax=Methylophaga sp. UBA678 TaxID=1946901 RepID=UPI000C5DA561|nr:LEA type 2 family protein [Methylophaga sp. UBA678]MAX52474.1 hypothetical protein [Methylophaga sp.]|tara:strand:- start:99607 stop:100083 length:477 start_codon:yes stop_codon:yes gene_type:complete